MTTLGTFCSLMAITLLSYFQIVAAPSDSLKQKNLRVTPLPVVYYSPETRLGFGALIATNFETDKIRGGETRSSYTQTYFLYTINKQYDIGTMGRIYFPENKSIFYGKVNYMYFPEYYYGVATEQPTVKKDTIQYQRQGADFRFYHAWKKITMRALLRVSIASRM